MVTRQLAPHPLRRFRLPGALLGLVVVYGTLGYLVIEGWSPLDAFYMTVITISTVGYDEVHPLSPAGKVFTTTLIVGGVATMLYAFGTFAELLSEGHLATYRRQRRMERRIAALRGHFIICGYGRIGTQVVQELDGAGMPYVVVDNNPEAVGRMRREDRLRIEDDAASEDVLHAAGIDRARGLISAVDSDERSVYITLAARALNPKLYILSRAGQPASIRRLELAGADRVISPYQMAGHHLAELALRPALVDLMATLHHGKADIAVEELLVAPGCAALGRTLEEAGLITGAGARLLALRREDGALFVNPRGDLPLQAGDLLIALGTVEQLARTAALLQAPFPAEAVGRPP